MIVTKKCASCQVIKPIEEFPRDKGKPDGYASSCKPCRRESKQKFLERNPYYNEMESWRRRYGLSREEYMRMYEDQEGRCFICGEEKKLHVDHDHRTNKVRALICHECNSVLGYSRENPAILQAGIEYLLLFREEE